ncbi:DUF523 domain-containing protein [Gracilibacillus phocaeensis]|uniref:DUF523 domain-containing protein n=1 Tax=Gracilibacillus phocaeensis TaxID=2042304 RepID=UPI00102F3D5D
MNICKRLGCDTLILKADSPSCGSQKIYSGDFNGTKKEGSGVLTALLTLHNIKVEDETNYSLLLDERRAADHSEQKTSNK